MDAFNATSLSDHEKAQIRVLRKRKIDLMDEIEAIKNEMQAVDAELETLYYVDEGSKSKNKLLGQGKKKFNADPERGLQWMIERGLLKPTSVDVADWLYTSATDGKGVSKAAIGDYLGQNDQFVLEVLDEFCRLHPIHDMHLVDSLRIFLGSFRLPGESQKIDRIIEKFSEHYCKVNVGVFKTTDNCYLIAYSCIMLNTLLHNPSVKDKPTVERYLSMNREMVDSGDVNRSMLINIYDSIKNSPFSFPRLPDDSASDLVEHSDCDGWLYKQSSNQFLSGPLSWKRRWFILSENCLYYFDQQGDKEPRGIIPLQNVGIRRVEQPSRAHMFEIYSLTPDERIKACKTENDGRMVEGRHSVYRICANSADDLQKWIEAIGRAIQTFPTRPRSTH